MRQKVLQMQHSPNRESFLRSVRGASVSTSSPSELLFDSNVGRSLIDLLGTIEHLHACGVDLYLDQQNIDTSTPMGRLVFQVTGAFAEFERSMIRERVNAGLARAVQKGIKLGRPRIARELEERIQ